MNVFESVIFLHQPGAVQALKERKKFKRLYRILASVAVLCAVVGLTTVVTMLIRGVGQQDIPTILLYMGCLCVGLLALAAMGRYEDRSEEATRDIERNIARLSVAMSDFNLETRNVEDIKESGWMVLVNKASNTLIFQNQVAAFKISSVDQPLRNVLFKAIVEEKERRYKEMSDLYDALLALNLVEPGGYSWAFKEAKKYMSLE